MLQDRSTDKLHVQTPENFFWEKREECEIKGGDVIFGVYKQWTGHHMGHSKGRSLTSKTIRQSRRT